MIPTEILTVAFIGGPNDGDVERIPDSCDHPGCDCSIIGGTLVYPDGLTYEIQRDDDGRVLAVFLGIAGGDDECLM